MAVHFRIVGTDLPGSTCGPSPERPDGHRNIHVGVQCKQEVVQRARGDAKQAVFEFEVSIKNGKFSGPYIHGRDGQRFIYLSWGVVEDGEFHMFRRAKLHVDHIDVAAADGHTVEGRLGLTDAKGNPTCASIRPPAIAWKVAR